MTDSVDVILDDAFKRVMTFVFVVASLWTLAVAGTATYVGWRFGVVEGRQRYESVACTPIQNERVKPGVKGVP